MEKGLPVIMDEINLLPWECRQALQSVTDGGDEVTISGEKIKIAPGFKVIATMNLIINGDTVPLPEPIIDRAGKIEKFETDFNLMALIAFGC